MSPAAPGCVSESCRGSPAALLRLVTKCLSETTTTRSMDLAVRYGYKVLIGERYTVALRDRLVYCRKIRVQSFRQASSVQYEVLRKSYSRPSNPTKSAKFMHADLRDSILINYPLRVAFWHLALFRGNGIFARSAKKNIWVLF